ncbi:MAG: DNA-binding response regulator [Chloroflexi bacterium]|nr:MAG: DNA-binding response regulator [Chloroflexota bacterium]RLC89180.1 MAG: DNA-binding response regulator [Chloroflexota bacterium]HEY66924.1 response regulator transcription factor [Thermoflexia bacterium]
MVERNQVARIMVVDDEPVARISLAEVLRLEGYQVATAASGEEALSLLNKSGPFDLMVLDLKMPGMDGLEVTEVVRKQSPGTVIILLTAFGTLETAIQAIRHGAHDYLLKPCPIPDILESVRKGLAKRQQEQQRQHLVSQLRRTLSELVAVEGAEMVEKAVSPQPGRFLQVRDVVVDRQKHVVMLRGQPLDLTPTEFKILVCLMETPDQVWSPQELIRRAQGYETDAWGARAIIRVHIRRLRKKMETDPSNPEYILNVRGVGYMFASSGPSQD